MNFEPRTVERIAREFPAAEQPAVAELLATYSGPEAERVIWDVLELSKGKLDRVKHFLEAAQRDYRDVLYWAEYYKDDPLLKGRDPRKLADDIIAKWGKKK